MRLTSLIRAIIARVPILRLVPTFLLLVLVAGCQDAQEPLDRAGPDVQAAVLAPAGVSSHFFLLPPLGSDKGSGDLDAALLPFARIVICEINGTACGRTVETILPGGTGLGISGNHFHANWQAKSGAVQAGRTYRMSFLVASTVVGNADILIGAKSKDLKDLAPGLIGAVINSTLPIKFRIEKGAVAMVTTAGGSASLPGVAATLHVPAGALDAPAAITFDALNPGDYSSHPLGLPVLAAVALGPVETAFAPPATLVLSYDATDVLPDIAQGDLAIFEIGVDGVWTELQSTVDSAARTVSAPVSELGNYVIAPVIATRAVLQVAPTTTPPATGDTITVTATAYSSITTRVVHSATFAFTVDTTRAAIVSTTGATARVALLKPGSIALRADVTGPYVAAGGVHATTSLTPLQYAYGIIATPSNAIVAVLGGTAHVAVVVLDRVGNPIADHPIGVTTDNAAIATAATAPGGIQITGGSTAGAAILTLHAITAGHDSVRSAINVDAQRITAAISADAATTAYGVAPSLTARLVPAVQGRTVRFTIAGDAGAVSAVTDGAGVATAQWPSQALRPDVHTVNAAITGDVALVDAAASATLQVSKAAAQLSLTLTPNPVLATDVLTARVLLQGPDGLPRAATVTLASPISATITTDANGIGTIEWPANAGAGSYSVTATFSGNDDFDAQSATASFNIALRPLTVTAAAAAGAYNGSATLSATLAPALASRELTFRLTATGATIGSATTDANGTAAVVMPIALAAGAHAYEVSVAGDGVFAAAQDDAVLTVARANATVQVSAASAVYASDMSFAAQVSPARAGTQVEFTIDGSVIGRAATNAAGAAALAYRVSVDAGAHAIGAAVLQDEYLAAAAGTAALTVERAAAQLALQDITASYGSAVTLSAAAAPARAGVPVEFAVDNVVVGASVTNADGNATLSYTVLLPAGVHAVTARAAEDCCYNGASAQATLTAMRAQASIAADPVAVAYGTAPVLTARILPGLPGRTIRFAIAGQAGSVTATTNALGVASVAWSGSTAAPGAHDISASLTGDTFLEDVETHAVLDVAKVIPQLQLSFAAPSIGYGDVQEIRVQFNGNTALGLARTVTIGGVAPMTIVTDATGAGVAQWSVSAAAGTHALTASFASDVAYESAQTSAAFTVTTAPSVITGASLTATYPQASVTLRAQVMPAVAGRPVHFSMAGTPGGIGVTDANGLAVHDVSLTMAPGNHAYEVSVDASDFHGAASGTGTVAFARGSQQLSAANMSVGYGAATSLNATLSPARPGATVEFRVDDNAVGSAVTNSAGAASLLYTAALAAGVHQVSATIAQDAFYTATSVQTVLTVSKATPQLTLSFTTPTVSYGGTLGIRVQFSAPAALGLVHAITIDGTPITITTGADGIGTATLPVTLDPGTHSLTARFAGSDAFVAAQHTAEFTVAAAASAIHPSDVVTFYPAATAPLRASIVPAVAGRTVVFTLGSETGTGLTGADGVATANIPTAGRAPGDYTYTATVSPGQYAGATATALLRIGKMKVVISLAPLSGTYGSTVPIAATVSPARAGIVITYSIDGVTVGSAQTNTQGVARLDYIITAGTGTRALSAAIAGDPFVDNTTRQTTLTVAHAPTQLSVASIPLSLGGTIVTARATLTPALAGSPITFTIGTTSVIGTTGSDGVAEAQFTVPQQMGTHAIHANFAGSSTHSASSGEGTLEAGPAQLAFAPLQYDFAEYPGQTRIIVGLTTPVAGKTIDIYMADNYIGKVTTGADGSAAFVFTPTQLPGTYDIRTSFAGDATHAPATATTSVVIAPAVVTIKVPPVVPTAQPAQTVPLTATVLRGGQPVANVNVTFTSGTRWTRANTNASGVVSNALGVSSVPGVYEYTATVTDPRYVAAEATGSYEVVVGTGTVTSESVLPATWSVPTHWIARVKPAIEGRTVQWWLNGILHGTATTDGKGLATIPFASGLPTNDYPMSVVVLANASWHESRLDMTYPVQRLPLTLTMANATTIPGTAKPMTVQTVPVLAGAEVHFSADGQAATVVTDAGGRATWLVPANVEGGNIQVTASINQSPYWSGNFVQATLSVVRTPTSMTLADLTVNAGSVISIQATLQPVIPFAQVELTIGTTPKITLEVNHLGQIIYDTQLQLAAGQTHPMTIRFAGDFTHAPSQASATLTVPIAQPVIGGLSKPVQVAYKQPFDVGIQSGPSTGTAFFTINGGTWSVPIINGNMRFQPFIPLNVGTYGLTVRFDGSPGYLPAIATGQVIVTPATPPLIFEPQTYEFGQVTLRATTTPGLAVDFFTVADNRLITSAVANSSGIAERGTFLQVGSHELRATVRATSNYSSVTRINTYTIVKAATSLVALPATSPYTVNAVLQARFADNAGGRTVRFQDHNGNFLGLAGTDGTGTARLVTGTFEYDVTRQFTASYDGDASHEATSTTAEWTKTKYTPFVIVSAPGTVTAGTQFTVHVEVPPVLEGAFIRILDGFNGTITGGVVQNGRLTVSINAFWGVGARVLTASYDGSVPGTLATTKAFQVTGIAP